MSENNQPATPASESENVDTFQNFIQAAGVILAVSYPVLALSTGTRAIYRLFFKDGVTDLFPPAMSLLAATSYLVATVGIVMRERWGPRAWWLSMIVLGVETAFTLVIGTLSIFYPELIGNTVWRLYGADYGFFPLFQPLLGIAWLMNRHVRESFRLTI